MVSGNVDVVVTDGFAGNVALKATEGAAEVPSVSELARRSHGVSRARSPRCFLRTSSKR